MCMFRGGGSSPICELNKFLCAVDVRGKLRDTCVCVCVSASKPETCSSFVCASVSVCVYVCVRARARATTLHSGEPGVFPEIRF